MKIFNIFKKTKKEVICINNENTDLVVGEVYQIYKTKREFHVHGKEIRYYIIKLNKDKNYYNPSRFKPYHRGINLDKILN